MKQSLIFQNRFYNENALINEFMNSIETKVNVNSFNQFLIIKDQLGWYKVYHAVFPNNSNIMIHYFYYYYCEISKHQLDDEDYKIS